MERLEPKSINGHTYYYYSKWEWVSGRCRRVWQKYLGKPRDIAQAVIAGPRRPQYAEVFQWGLPTALWRECTRAGVIEAIDDLSPKRDQGLSTGVYLAIAAINRAICPQSKRSMWEWFSETVLLRHLSQASKTTLTSQRFWDHMDRIDRQTASAIWKRVLKGVIQREQIDLSSICYDGTNFYTFIDTFNTHCPIAKRGKNKQGRVNLRQVNYALFCSADGQLPIYYDVYEGNRHDAKQFPKMISSFHDFLQGLADATCPAPRVTIVFDKGNNSTDNFALVDALALDYVGSLKLDEHKEIAQVSNSDARFTHCSAQRSDGTKAFRVKKTVYGKERTLIVTYNQNLFDSQWLTLQNDMTQAIEKLARLRQQLDDRVAGIITGGRAPTCGSVQKQCADILRRQHLKALIKTQVTMGTDGLTRLGYLVDGDALRDLADTHLGKNIIVTSHDDWDDDAIISAYRSQFLIEDIFKGMKDHRSGTWWPLYHWTESKIRVHGLYCSLAQLFRALALRRVRQAGIQISTKRFLAELDKIREVINIYPRTGRRKTEQRMSVLTKTSPLQDQLMTILGLSDDANLVLG